jgi:hypothetical protein
VDYEAELALIIGKEGRDIKPEHAYDHIFGYTIVNDVTARDRQRNHKQWFLGKALDTFCPMGPWIATSDDLDPENLDVKCWVNGELRQNANTSDLIFGIPTLVATISAGLTLKPGDINATRHARRRRPWLQPAKIPPCRRHRVDLDQSFRHADQYIPIVRKPAALEILITNGHRARRVLPAIFLGYFLGYLQIENKKRNFQPTRPLKLSSW